jgi:hypothetical protein
MAGVPCLTERGQTVLAYELAVFELLQRDHDGVMGCQAFNDFARARGISDACDFSRHLTKVRNRLPALSTRLPTIDSFPGRTEASNAPGRGAPELRLSAAFLHHLDQVNRTLRVALEWLEQPVLSRTSLRKFAANRGCGNIHNYVHSDSTSLTERGKHTLTYELAAFDWIQHQPGPELTRFAIDRGLDSLTLKFYASRAEAKLRTRAP